MPEADDRVFKPAKMTELTAVLRNLHERILKLEKANDERKPQ
jgi:DNA-binding response OmpR family regulator